MKNTREVLEKEDLEKRNLIVKQELTPRQISIAQGVGFSYESSRNILTGNKNIIECIFDGRRLDLHVIKLSRLADYVSGKISLSLSDEKFIFECDKCGLHYEMPLSLEEQENYKRAKRQYNPQQFRRVR